MRIILLTKVYEKKMGGAYTVIKSMLGALSKDITIKTHDRKTNFIILIKEIKDCDVCHFFGGWDFFHFFYTLIAFIMKKKVVIHPLGFYEPWSLEQKKIKKKLAWFFYQKRILKKADLIHCASKIEQINLLKLDKKFKTRILPFGIPNIFFNRRFRKKLNQKAIFFSRIHPKKGLEDLINQWVKIDNKVWQLDIYGPYEDESYYNYLLSILKKNKTSKIKFFKPIYSDKAKVILFKKYDFFILPTKNENFSLSIAEALASSLPVLTNKNAPWKSIKKNNAGWFIGTSSYALNQTLRKIFNLKYNDFLLKKKNAFNLSQSFNWKTISPGYIKEYDKLIKL